MNEFLWLEFRFSLLSPLVIRFAPSFDTRAASPPSRKVRDSKHWDER